MFPRSAAIGMADKLIGLECNADETNGLIVIQLAIVWLFIITTYHPITTSDYISVHVSEQNSPMKSMEIDIWWLMSEIIAVCAGATPTQGSIYSRQSNLGLKIER
jgi:hypothetical protein